MNILVKGQFLVSKKGVEIMRKQDLGGDIVNVVSKNAIVAGPNNAGYWKCEGGPGTFESPARCGVRSG
jgi:NAD(P)-dependent dehydrogenase (short-subunit alcohol dehydrogenase family)